MLTYSIQGIYRNISLSDRTKERTSFARQETPVINLISVRFVIVLQYAIATIVFSSGAYRLLKDENKILAKFVFHVYTHSDIVYNINYISSPYSVRPDLVKIACMSQPA